MNENNEIKCGHVMLVNEDELVSIVKQSHPFFDETYIKGLIELILDNTVIKLDANFNKSVVNEAFDLIEKALQDCRNRLNSNNETVQEVKKENKSVNVTDYISKESLHSFREKMFHALVEEINKERKARNFDEIPYEHIRTSIHFRSAYIEYGTFYKRIVNDNRYNTDEDYLMSMFFLEHIFYQDAYHSLDPKGENKVPFLKADNATVYALMSETPYKGMLKGITKSTLLKSLFEQYPEYELSNVDWANIVKFIRNKLYHPER